MNRVTIRTLMALVVVTAVGLAGLRNANGLWAGSFLLITLTLLLTAVLGAVYTSGPSRAGWQGFSIFSFAYLALVLSPLIPSHLTGNLPTVQLLQYVHTRVAPPMGGMGGGMMPGMGMSMSTAPGMGMGMGMMPGYSAMSAGTTMITTSPPATPNHWMAILPGAANYESFTSIGHCLFALLSGLIGAVVARRFERGGATAGTGTGR